MSTSPQVGTLVAIFAVVFASAAMAQTCPFADSQHCQLFDDSLNFVQSDRDFGRDTFGRRAADDFVATSPFLNKVCVWGFYIDQDPNAVDGDCGPAAVDHFVVRVGTNYYSGIYYVGSSTPTSQRVEVPGTQIETVLGNKMYQYTLTLNIPITNLTTGWSYWLEVYNDVDDGIAPTCVWQWSRQVASSTSFSVTTSGSDYKVGREAPFDNVFCTNFALGQSSIGAMLRACCICGGNCSEQTLADCAGMGGVWHVDNPNCTGVACDSAPSNDACENAPLVAEGQFDFSQACASADGFCPIETDSGRWPMERDVWYRFIAPANCQLTINTCATSSGLDTMLAVYHNPDDPTTCPPCPLQSDPNGAAISAATLAGQAQDESCTDGLSYVGGEWIDSQQLGRTTLLGECFLIRAGVYPYGPDDYPTESVRIVCRDENTPPPPEPDPTGLNKVRFISFQIPPGIAAVGQAAIRVHLVSLNHVWPPYIELPIPFTAFEGLDVWVGPPQEYVESYGTETTFLASVAQCTPHYQDWSTVGLVHVTGTAIVPSSIYRIDVLNSSCQGREEEFDCLAGGGNVSSQLEVKTTRWGDVEEPFNPPSPATQPDLADVGVLVNKFRNAPGAPIKARAMLIGKDGFGTMDIAEEFNFTHIAACVNAFRGQGYPHKIGRCSVGGSPCTINSDCTEAGGAGPCTLYCP